MTEKTRIIPDGIWEDFEIGETILKTSVVSMREVLCVPNDVFKIFKNGICFVVERWSHGSRNGEYDVRRLRKTEITPEIKSALVDIGFSIS